MPATNFTSDPSDNASPDWNAHPTDLLCPLCGYNLRHLTVARCPECGFAFQWAELIEAEKNRHKYLFEHGSGHKLKTFWKTYWTTCRPRKFWSDLNPAQPVHLVRLIVYWTIATGLMSCCLCGSQISDIVRTAVQLERQNAAYRSMFVPILNKPGFYTEGNTGTNTPLTSARDVITKPQMDALWPHPWQFDFWKGAFELRGGAQSNAGPSGIGWAAIFIFWPWLTLLSLMVFRTSMRQAKIRTVQVLRAIIYSCDFGLLFAILYVSLYVTNADLADGWLLLPSAIICSIVTSYRLTIAFEKYLRVHLPLATVLASQIIAVLVVFTVLVPIVDFSRRT